LRFFDVLLSRRLTASEKAAIADWLRRDETELFFAQPPEDQSHGYHAALSVVASGVGDRTVIRAALLHDVGKRHARLSVIGRSLASVLLALGIPLTERMSLYRDHGEIGARELEDLGCEPIVVAFARSHQSDHRPQSIVPANWNVLLAADQPPKARVIVGL
jgi:putative nucleotidyltransferase with HDIG domain